MGRFSDPSFAISVSWWLLHLRQCYRVVLWSSIITPKGRWEATRDLRLKISRDQSRAPRAASKLSRFPQVCALSDRDPGVRAAHETHCSPTVEGPLTPRESLFPTPERALTIHGAAVGRRLDADLPRLLIYAVSIFYTAPRIG